MLTELKKSVTMKFEFLSKMFKTYPLSLAGIVMILSFAVIALLAPILAPPTSSNPYICPYSGPPEQADFSGILPPPTLPSSEHPFGTMHGYDVYYGCIWGVRTAFRISILTTFITLAIGLVIGSFAGYLEGLVDEFLMRFTDAFFALPGLLYVMLIVMALPLQWKLNLGSLNLTIALSGFDRIILALAIIGWPPYARLIRGEIKKVKEQDFVEAAKAIGCSKLRVLTRHILPNSIDSVLSLAFLNIGGVILATSTVSFLGFGPGISYAEWGTIIANGRSLLVFTTADASQFVVLLLIPGAFLSAFVLGWSLLGDALRTIMDPVLARRMGA